MVDTIAADSAGLSDAPLFPLDAGAKFFLGLLSPYVGAVFMETFLFGTYTILFSICLFVLLRKHRTLHITLLLFAVLMYAIAAADVGYTYWLVFNRLLGGGLSFRDLYPKCFVVWGRQKRVIVGPLLLLIATAVSGYLFEGAAANLFKHAWVYLAMTFALNIILTCLTAGRIWYLRHRTRTLLGEGLLQRYNATLTILVESGVLYSTYMVLDLAFQNHPIASTILDAGLIQVVGIMPTLIIVQVGLGRAIHDIDSSSQAQLNHTHPTTIALDPLSRIEANKSTHSEALGKFVAVPNEHGGYGYYGPGYFRSSRDEADGEESRRSSKVLSDFDDLGGVGLRSAGVLSDVTTTVDSRSEIVLNISKANALPPPKRSLDAERERPSRVPEVLRINTWASSKRDSSGAASVGGEGSFTPAPQRRMRSWRSTGSRSTLRHKHHPSTSFDADDNPPVPGPGLAATAYPSSPLSQGYRYPSPRSPPLDQEEEEHRSFSQSKRTLFNEDSSPPISQPPPRSQTLPLPSPPPNAAYAQKRLPPTPPGISPTSPTFPLAGHGGTPTQPAPGSPYYKGAASPLSRLVDEIARPKPSAASGAGYFDSSLSASWGQPRWTDGRARESSFPVPVSVGPSRASSINESAYSPI